ncbi:MAG: AAA family ATPase [Polyangiaceae bacterium]
MVGSDSLFGAAASGRYPLGRVLGEGGVGRVYASVDQVTGRPVAIKVLRAPLRGRADQQAMLHEAAAWARLDHPHVVELIDVGERPDGAVFLVLERANGRALGGLAADGGLLAGLAGVLEALAHAHARGVVHGDVKPANLLRVGATWKLTDFGAARVLFSKAGVTTPTGTYAYMAPEQFREGDAPAGVVVPRVDLGPEADLYAVGCVMLELALGRLPFSGEPREILARKRDVDGLLAPLAPPLRALLARLLAWSPWDRPRFAREVASAVASLDASMFLTDAARGVAPGDDSRSSQASLGGAWFDERETEALSPDEGVGGTAHPRAWRRLRALPLVARETERRALEDAIERARSSGAPAVLLFEGDTGVGKSAIAEWGFRHVEEQALALRTKASYDDVASATEGLEFAVRALLRASSFGGMASAPALRASSTVGEALARFDARQVDVAKILAWLAPRNEAARVPAPQVVASLLCAVVRLAERGSLAPSRRLAILLWLDDVAWAPRADLEIVEALAALDDLPVVIVGTARAGAIERAPEKSRLERIFEEARVLVQPLDREGRAALAEEAVGLARDASRGFADVIDQPAAMALQVLFDWTENDVFVAAPEGLVLAPGSTFASWLEARPPASAIEARFERAFGAAGDGARRVLEVAALFGVRFARPALAAAFSQCEPAGAGLVDNAIDRALFASLVRLEPSGACRFDHAILRDALEASLDRRDKTHARAARLAVADCLKHHFGARYVSGFLRASELERAAGEIALACASLADAASLLARMGSLNRAHEVLADARALATSHASRAPAVWAPIFFAEGRVAYFVTRYGAAMRALRAAARLARAAGNRALAVRADAVRADVLFWLERFAECEALLTFLEPALPTDTSLESVVTRSGVHHRRYELAAARAAAAPSGSTEAAALWAVAVAENRAAVELTRAAGLPSDALVHLSNRLDLALVLGEREVAEEVSVLLETGARDHAEVTFEWESASLRLALVRGDFALAKARCATLLARSLENQDAWRETSARLYLAWAALGTADAGAVAAVEAFLEAELRSPHDEPFTFHAMAVVRDLVAPLDRALAERVERCRRARLDRGPPAAVTLS